MVRRNAGIPDEKQIVFRIGINVGDIIIDGDDIFGDGVNIAARLETLCEPGGVCISRTANDQIRDKLSLAFADLGEQAVKNISRAVGVFGLTAMISPHFQMRALAHLPTGRPVTGLIVMIRKSTFAKRGMASNLRTRGLAKVLRWSKPATG